MQSSAPLTSSAPPDAAAGNAVDRFAPAGARPYLRLMRLDRPIGAWLLFWPCAWSFALAFMADNAPAFTAHHAWLLLLLAVGALLMRAAGCCWNDVVDRDIDRRVRRSRSRPLANESVSLPAALAVLAGLLLAAFALLLQFNGFTVLLALAAVPLVCFYPFAKRVTALPQLFLGMTFGWGALVGWSAVAGGLALPPALLYGACVSWIVGYDTIYAMQDKEEDALLSLGSSALLWGEASRWAVAVCYGAALLLLLAAGASVGGGWVFYGGMAAAGAHFGWQVARLGSANDGVCLRLFQSNREVGLLVFLALALGGL